MGYRLEAFLFDLVGTLVYVEDREDLQVKLMVDSLRSSGFNFREEEFIRIYREIFVKYSRFRHSRLLEVPNTVWLTETLRRLGYEVESSDKAVIEAVEEYFKPYVESARILECAPRLLEELRSLGFKTGLVSNFTYAKTARTILKKLGLDTAFDSIAISEEIGFRKPHPAIFEKPLKELNLEPSRCIFSGDNPYTDIYGAGRLGMKTILVLNPAELYDEACYEETIYIEEPDYILDSVCDILPEILQV